MLGDRDRLFCRSRRRHLNASRLTNGWSFIDFPPTRRKCEFGVIVAARGTSVPTFAAKTVLAGSASYVRATKLYILAELAVTDAAKSVVRRRTT